jgi:2-polyprenyl-3-methyl-5-hydroxy-6-metoxy-1,4-benzoquinol methylase
MDKIVLISARTDTALYTKCMTENPFIRDNPSCVMAGFDNSVENPAIPVHYNRFLDTWDYADAAWFVFCRSDWETREDLVPLLRHLDPNTLYGPVGAILYSNDDGSFTHEYRGRYLEKMRDGSNERLACSPVHHTGALVDTLDGQCLVVHSSLIAQYRLRFDENPGFDLYVEDFCIDAREKHDIKSRILDIRCACWNLSDTADARQNLATGLAHVEKKHPGSCRGSTAGPLGGAARIVGPFCKHILPRLVHTGQHDDPREKIYQAEVTPDNQNSTHAFFLQCILPGSAVLDVGCAGGYLGVALKRSRQCDVHGFEYSPASVDLARKTGAYREVRQVDLDTLGDNAYPEYFGQFDAIVFGDILEHLYNPEDALRKLLAYLKPGGSLLISLPNVAHASIVANLLRGDFSYTRVGLLDNTHIRFFTRNSIPVFLARNRLVVREYRYTVVPAQGFQPENPYPHLPAAVTTSLFNEPHSFVCQYVIRAQLDEVKSFDDCLAANTVLHTLDENANPHLKHVRDQAFAQYPPPPRKMAKT